MRAYVTAAALTYRSGDKQVFTKGEQVDLPKEVVSRLIELGMVSKTREGGRSAKQAAPAPVSGDAKPAEDDAETVNTVDVDSEDDASDPLDESDASDERPARSASIDEWRTYAEANGLATKGLSKQEIIAALG